MIKISSSWKRFNPCDSRCRSPSSPNRQHYQVPICVLVYFNVACSLDEINLVPDKSFVSSLPLTSNSTALVEGFFRFRSQIKIVRKHCIHSSLSVVFLMFDKIYYHPATFESMLTRWIGFNTRESLILHVAYRTPFWPVWSACCLVLSVHNAAYCCCTWKTSELLKPAWRKQPRWTLLSTCSKWCFCQNMFITTKECEWFTKMHHVRRDFIWISTCQVKSYQTKLWQCLVRTKIKN